MCDVDGCPCTDVDESGLCVVHRATKRLEHVMVGAKCTRCKRYLQVGEFVARDSTLEAMEHLVCPPKRPRLGVRRDDEKPLLKEL